MSFLTYARKNAISVLYKFLSSIFDLNSGIFLFIASISSNVCNYIEFLSFEFFEMWLVWALAIQLHFIRTIRTDAQFNFQTRHYGLPNQQQKVTKDSVFLSYYDRPYPRISIPVSYAQKFNSFIVYL